MFRFAVKLKRKRLHIQRFLTLLLLGVFTMAITPWGALHHHENQAVSKADENCTHKFHIKTQQENCLICAAHFEKNYISPAIAYTIFLQSEAIVKLIPQIGNSFTELISTSLRGPPVLA